jgi:hypothetical protein
LENGKPIALPPAPWWRDRRKMLGAILAAAAALILLGGVYAWFHRHDTICSDRLPPVAQRDVGIGQVQFRCHNGELVTRP